MNSAALNKLVRCEMHFDVEYSFEKMEGIYNDIMDMGLFAECKKASRKTLHNQLSEWANVEGGWLGKKGKGKGARFYKIEPPLLSLSLEGITRKAKVILRGLSWDKW